MAKNSWIELIKKHVKEVKKEGKIKGKDIIKESIKRARIEFKKTKEEK